MAERGTARPRARPARDADAEREDDEREYDEREDDDEREYDEDEYDDDEYDEPAGNEPEDEETRPPRRGRSGSGEGDDQRRQRPARQSDGGLTAAQAGKLGLRQIAELTGKQTEGVTWVQRDDDDGGGWAVGVEVVEDRRIPSAADILAIYETELDMDGELLSYRRVRRYARGRGDDATGGQT